MSDELYEATFVDRGLIEDILPAFERREVAGRLPGFFYVHLFGLYRSVEVKMHFVQVLAEQGDKEIVLQLRKALAWMQEELVKGRIVYCQDDKLSVSYYLEFDHEADAVEAKLTFFSFF